MTNPPPGVSYWSRDDWQAEPPLTPLTPFRPPAAWLFVHHTVTAVTRDVAANFRKVQDVAFGRGFADVSYGELIGPEVDGNVAVAEGRGVQWVGAHTVAGTPTGDKDLNPVSVGIAFVGNYHPPAGAALELTDAQVAAFRWRRRALVAAGWLTPDHAVKPHRYVYGTACAGDNVIARIDELAAPLEPDAPPHHPAPSEDDMAHLITPDDGDIAVFATDGVTKTWLRDGRASAALRDTGVVRAALDGSPIVLPRSAIDSLFTVGGLPRYPDDYTGPRTTR